MKMDFIAKAMRWVRGRFREAAPRPALPVTPFETPLDAVYSMSRVVFEVPICYCQNLYFQSYAQGASNPYVETIRDYSTGIQTVYEGSRLYHYHERCRRDPLANPFEAFIANMAALCPRLAEWRTEGGRFPFPWDGPTPVPEQTQSGGAKLQGKATRIYLHEKAEQNFSRLVSVYESICRHGYQPTSAPDGEIHGFFLKRAGEYRFIVQSGMHRMAVLSALGYKEIRATFRRDSVRLINGADLENWPGVKAGVYEPHVARLFLERYFLAEDSSQTVQGVADRPA
jgi:hypothetical protein